MISYPVDRDKSIDFIYIKDLTILAIINLIDFIKIVEDDSCDE